MKAVPKIFVAVLLASTACAEAGTPSKDRLIRLIADATAWSKFCVNDAVDPDAVTAFRAFNRITVNAHYYDVFGLAYAYNYALATDSHRFFHDAACQRARDLYGPLGASVPGLVRPLWSGTVPNQRIDVNGWVFR
jgi:hypothetical protein